MLARSLLLSLLLLLPTRGLLAQALDPEYDAQAARALARYGSPEAVPAASVSWLARRYQRDEDLVRDDLYRRAGRPRPTRLRLPTDLLALSPLELGLARGVVGMMLVLAALWIGSPPRSAAGLAPHLRAATGAGSLAPRLLALYLGASGLWELAGAGWPEYFELGAVLFFFRGWGPAIQKAVGGARIFHAF